MTSSKSDMDFIFHVSQFQSASLISCVQQPVRPVATLVDGAGSQGEGKDEADFTPQEGAGITTCRTEQRGRQRNQNEACAILPWGPHCYRGFQQRVNNFVIASACGSCAFNATPSGLAVKPTSVWWSGRVTPLKRARWLLRGFSLIGGGGPTSFRKKKTKFRNTDWVRGFVRALCKAHSTAAAGSGSLVTPGKGSNPYTPASPGFLLSALYGFLLSIVWLMCSIQCWQDLIILLCFSHHYKLCRNV